MYTTEDELTKIETTFENDTVWLWIVQMADLFQRDKSKEFIVPGTNDPQSTSENG